MKIMDLKKKEKFLSYKEDYIKLNENNMFVYNNFHKKSNKINI